LFGFSKMRSHAFGQDRSAFQKLIHDPENSRLVLTYGLVIKLCINYELELICTFRVS
jgi:hypothetical protein